MKTFDQPKYFITGIDTGIGKTMVTGFLANYLGKQGINVITQKLVQTGCRGISEDILKHRKLAQQELFDVDNDLTTCPYVFEFPSSPHLAAELEGKSIDLKVIQKCTETLLSRFDKVLMEGAGGIFVPITRNYFTIDYISDQHFPVVVVTSSRLGSINHTLLTLEACRSRNIKVAALVYNNFNLKSPEICRDSESVLKQYLKTHFQNAMFWNIEELQVNTSTQY